MSDSDSALFRLHFRMFALRSIFPINRRKKEGNRCVSSHRCASEIAILIAILIIRVTCTLNYFSYSLFPSVSLNFEKVAVKLFHRPANFTHVLNNLLPRLPASNYFSFLKSFATRRQNSFERQNLIPADELNVLTQNF